MNMDRLGLTYMTQYNGWVVTDEKESGLDARAIQSIENMLPIFTRPFCDEFGKFRDTEFCDATTDEFSEIVSTLLDDTVYVSITYNTTDS